MLDTLALAIYHTVHDAPGGAVGLAPKVGMNAGTLQNKVNPSREDAQLNLRESVPIQLHLRDFRILGTYAVLLDHAVIPLGDFKSCSDLELLDLYAEYHREIGETAAAIRAALAEHRLTQAQVRQVRREFIEDTQAGLAFLARLEAIAEGDS